MSRLRWRTPPSMWARGPNESWTSRSAAVAGMSCISPSAPRRETARTLNCDSTATMAAMSLGKVRADLELRLDGHDGGDELGLDAVAPADLDDVGVDVDARIDLGRARRRLLGDDLDLMLGGVGDVHARDRVRGAHGEHQHAEPERLSRQGLARRERSSECLVAHSAVRGHGGDSFATRGPDPGRRAQTN